MAYARNITRNTAGLHPNLRGLGGLGFLGQQADGTITAAEALQQALSAYSGFHLNPKDDYTDPSSNGMTAQIQAGQFLPYPGCTGQAPSLNLFKTASGLALGTTSAGVGILASTGVIAAATSALLGAVTMGVGAIFAVIDLIFAHHAAAVARDLNFSCGAVPAVNNAFTLIAQAVADGTMTPDVAAQSLTEIYSNFMTAGGASGGASGPGSIPSSGEAINDSPYCNSNCELSLCLLGMVFYWQSQYQAMAAQQEAEAAAAPTSSTGGASVSSPTSSAGTSAPSTAAAPAVAASLTVSDIPTWAWFAAAAFAIWAVM